MAPLRHLRSLSMLFAPSFTSSLSTLAISVARIRQSHNPEKLYFGAKVAAFAGGVSWNKLHVDGCRWSVS